MSRIIPNLRRREQCGYFCSAASGIILSIFYSYYSVAEDNRDIKNDSERKRVRLRGQNASEAT